MNYYCVNKNAQSNGDHEVHNVSVGCSFLPHVNNRINLGYFDTCHGAVREARKHFYQVNGCYYCCGACHTS